MDCRQFSIVINLNGFCHVSNPETVLRKSYVMANDYLFVQTAVSLRTDGQNYFETPAQAGQGRRSSRKWFDSLVLQLGYNVIENHFIEYSGFDRPEGRGGVFYPISAS